MKESYIAPEAELLRFAPVEGIANDYDNWGAWARTTIGGGENPNSDPDNYEHPEESSDPTDPNGG